MKIKDLIEGKWVSKSQDGVERRFKNLDDAEAWKKSIAKKPKQKPLSFDDMFRDETPKVNKPSDFQIWMQAEQAVGAGFPDGDPIDYLSPYMKKHHLTMDDIDRAARTQAKAKSFYDYLADIWDDFARDALRDAHEGAYGDAYDGQWFTRKNPWR